MSLQYLTLHQWRRRPARALLTVFSVAIAVTALLGTSLAQSTVRRAYRKLALAVEGPPALEVVAAQGGRFAASVLPSLSDTPGVLETAPLISRATSARLASRRLRTVVVGVETEGAPRAWEQIRLTAGRAPEKVNEALLAANIAESMEVELGAQARFLFERRGPRAITIVGLAEPTSLRELMPGATLAVPARAVQEWSAAEGQIDRVRVLLAAGADRDAVERELTAILPKELEVQLPGGQMLLPDSMLRSTELALLFAGALSLAMAAFLVVNTLRMNFSERRKQLATLRALGATRGQVGWLVVTEGVWIGVLGAALGVPGGLALAYSLAHSMERLLGVELPTSAPRWDTLLASLAVAPLVSLLAACVPALQSRRVSPIEELAEYEPSRVALLRGLALLFSITCGAAAGTLIYLIVAERIAPEAAIAATLLVLLAIAAILPEAARPLVRGSHRALGVIWGVAGRLAAEQLLRRPLRTGLTAGVLVIALGSGLGLGNAILNNVQDVQTWYRRYLTGDFFLYNQMTGELAEEDHEDAEQGLFAELRKLPGVGPIVSFRLASGRVIDAPALFVVRDFPEDVSLPWAISETTEQELRQRLAEGQVVIASVLARRLGLKAGDTARLELWGQTESLKVAAVVNDYHQGGMVAFLDRGGAGKTFELLPADAFMLQAKPGVDPREMQPALNRLSADRGLILQSFAEMRGQLDLTINGIVVALWGLLAIGFVVGGFAVANTLTMSVLEQTRELGLLRIVGMTRGQLRRMVFCEALLLGLVGLVLGTATGAGTALIIHACNEPVLGHRVPFVFHYWLVGASAGGCLLVTVLSAWLPCRRAARLDVLEAIAYE